MNHESDRALLSVAVPPGAAPSLPLGGAAPVLLRDRISAAAKAKGQTDQEWIRGACLLALSDQRRQGGLTSRQRRLLEFIRAFIRENGFSPSYAEMTAAMGLTSKSNVHRCVQALEERRFIRFARSRARSIELVG